MEDEKLQELASESEWRDPDYWAECDCGADPQCDRCDGSGWREI